MVCKLLVSRLLERLSIMHSLAGLPTLADQTNLSKLPPVQIPPNYCALLQEQEDFQTTSAAH